MLCDQRFDDLLKTASEDFIEFVQREVDPVIGDSTLWEIIGTNALRPVAAADQAAERHSLDATRLTLDRAITQARHAR